MLRIHIANSDHAMRPLELPMPMNELRWNLEYSIRQSKDHLFIFDVDSPVANLTWHLLFTKLDSDDTLQKLNHLAETIDGMNTAGHYHLSKHLSTDNKQTLDDLLQIAAQIKQPNMDCYEFIPDVINYHALGDWLVDHDRMKDKVPESLLPYLDYYTIGMNYCKAHEGEFLPGGYVGIRTEVVKQSPEDQGILRLILSTSTNTFALSLPATEERLEQTKRALDVGDFAQVNITAVKFSSPYLANLLPLGAVSVEDANTLALCLKEMEQEDGAMIKFCAVLVVEQPNTFAEALNIAMDRDDYELVPENTEEYGKQVLRRIGADDEIIDTIDGYMDFAQLGRDSMKEDGVRQTTLGQVRRLSKPFPPELEIGQAMM